MTLLFGGDEGMDRRDDNSRPGRRGKRKRENEERAGRVGGATCLKSKCRSICGCMRSGGLYHVAVAVEGWEVGTEQATNEGPRSLKSIKRKSKGKGTADDLFIEGARRTCASSNQI